MKKITLRMPDDLHGRFTQELAQWQKVRGPKFSLNDLCIEKLAAPTQITAWPQTFTASTGSVNTVTGLTFTIAPGDQTCTTTRKERKTKKRK